MPSLETAATMLSSTGTLPSTSTSTSTSTSAAYIYSYATSKIVRTAVAAGVIVLALTALVLFFKISSWIRTRQRLSRQRYITSSLQSEQRANAYEIAAWADEPGLAPTRVGEDFEKRNKKKSQSRKEKREEMRAVKRGGANAWGVHEWEGVAA